MDSRKGRFIPVFLLLRLEFGGARSAAVSLGEGLRLTLYAPNPNVFAPFSFRSPHGAKRNAGLIPPDGKSPGFRFRSIRAAALIACLNQLATPGMQTAAGRWCAHGSTPWTSSDNRRHGGERS